jgi:E3 ubiquitin-protein ligase RFWD2
LNDVVAKFRCQTAASRGTTEGSHNVAEVLDMTAEFSQNELSVLLRRIVERSHQKAKEEQKAKTSVALHFVNHALERKERELSRLQAELGVLYSDRDRLTEKQETQAAEPSLSQEVQAVVPSRSPPADWTALLPLPFGSDLSAAMNGIVSQQTARVEANFDEILEDYLSIKLPGVGEPPDGAESLEQFSDDLQKFTKYKLFRELATLTYGDPSSNCCIVSSIEFDRDGEFFAVAGVTKKIKVFQYKSVIRNTGFTNHFPVHDMSCAAKLSCVAYNPYHKHHLVSSDYEGCVCVWDTNVGRRTSLHQEHSRRVWSVAYSPQEPSLFASGSDDCTVKLWSMGQPNSIFSFSAKANICSVKFNPLDRYLLAYGSADHGVHYVDLRSPNKPLLELLGHRKAVSYVSFMGRNELVSASTDSELKTWNTDNGVCLRTYRGHTNDKNFVGLTVTPDFIACGSENNAVYAYAKQVSSPMLTYQYGTPRGLLPSSAAGEPDQSPEPSEFVSAVSWRRNSNILLAANSQGYIKVLEMSP